MPTPRGTHGAGILNGEVYTVAGAATVTLATVEIYDPVANSWRAGTPVSSPRANPAVCAVGGRILAMRGGNPVSTSLSLKEVLE